MNKQEAIEKIEKLKGLTIKEKNLILDIEMIPKGDVLEIIEQIDEPEKPVIPKYVADWIEWCKKHKVTLLGAVIAICDNKNIRSLDASGWATKNQETFTKAWFYGYKVEKEKLYTAFQIATEEYLYTNVVGKLSSAHVSYAFVEEIKKYHFTQQKLEELKYWKNPAFEIKEVKK